MDWSASTVSGNTTNAWVVGPHNGGTANDAKTATTNVVCVAP